MGPDQETHSFCRSTLQYEEASSFVTSASSYCRLQLLTLCCRNRDSRLRRSPLEELLDGAETPHESAAFVRQEHRVGWVCADSLKRLHVLQRKNVIGSPAFMDTLEICNHRFFSGVRHSDQRLPLALSCKDFLLPNALRTKNCALLLSFGFENDGTFVALCLHLSRHGLKDLGRRVHRLDFRTRDLDAPGICCNVDDLGQLVVDILARDQQLIKVQTARYVANGCLRKLEDGLDEIAYLVDRLDRVRDVVVENNVDLRGNIVLCDDTLGFIVEHRLPQVDNRPYAVEDRDQEMQTRFQLPAEFSETLDDDSGALTHDDDIPQSENKNNNNADHPPDNGPVVERLHEYLLFLSHSEGDPFDRDDDNLVTNGGHGGLVIENGSPRRALERHASCTVSWDSHDDTGRLADHFFSIRSHLGTTPQQTRIDVAPNECHERKRYQEEHKELHRRVEPGPREQERRDGPARKPNEQVVGKECIYYGTDDRHRYPETDHKHLPETEKP